MTRRCNSRRLMKRVFRWGRLGLCVSLAVFLAMDPNVVHRRLAQAQTALESKANQEAQLKELADKMEKMFSALEDVQKEIPRETFDPMVIINGQPEVGFKGVGKDPEQLFEWVRDNTYLVPYRGALRDYKGVLMDRLGNSLDRALLLFVLLRQAWPPRNVRLAYAELSAEKAAELLDKGPSDSRRRRATAVRRHRRMHLPCRLEKYAEKYDLDPN